MSTRDEAYDQIDRFLRNNLDDVDYADYSQALDLIYTTTSAAPDWHPCRDVDGATCADRDECASGCIRIRPPGVGEVPHG